MASLAERLKEKGADLPDGKQLPNLPGLAIVSHAELSISDREKKQLFTPLEEGGQQAIQAEEKFKRECEQDLLKEVKTTVIRWAQECLANHEKHKQLQEKGMLKCRVQARWSKELNQNLHTFFENLGARIAASCEKDNAASERPAWEKYAARDEKWIIGFNVSAFDSFIKVYPQCLGPIDVKLRDFVEDYCRKVNLETCTIRAVFDALEARYGPLMRSFKNRVKGVLAEVVTSIEEERRRSSKKEGGGRGGGGASKRPRLSPAADPGLTTAEDAAWAAEVLAPLGLRPGGGEPLVKPPPAVLAQVLAALRALAPTTALLKATNLGIIVGHYRQHPSQEVSGVA
eukprot:CAMPEP_0179291004 /NCGR_PEP_ID=MMETSP0797-20121207/42116_1 /TAXON_ID=47934 /ORGANISM="Dinophysis acuminata, Strain DAEP01" /LENGTH=342 /DNA_ID=CAMNT_0021000071 /DNA_START=51 /DNA_END=1076 /DNA_ORIENTATION=-